MNRPVTRVIHLLTGAVLGFLAGSSAVGQWSGTNTATDWHQPPQAVISSHSGLAAAHDEKFYLTSESLPAFKHFQAMSAEAKLEFAASLEALSPLQREAFLRECAAWPEPESTRMLRVILCGWAETDPAGAADWAYGHLEARANDCFEDIAEIWASRDGEGLAAWSRSAMRNKKLGLGQDVRGRTPPALGRFNPVAMAELLEADGFHYALGDFDFSRSLGTPGNIRALAAKLPGHVEYISDIEELNRQLASKSSSPRSLPVKTGWNALFEQTATALHRISPQECDAWLAQFPEGAQLVARHEIAKLSKAKPEAPGP